MEIPLHAPLQAADLPTPAAGRALCLSGGGYRAMLFHLGAVWRLNQLGVLPTLSRISSVSGGSILAALLGLRWSQLRFVAGVATNFGEEIVTPIRRLAGRTLDAGAVLRGALLPGSAHDRFAASLAHHLYGDATLQDVTAAPDVVFNATNLQTGGLWRFSRARMGDDGVGQILHPTTPVATAVAASAAFPPVLSPAVLRAKPGDFAPGSGGPYAGDAFRRRILLADGGVYDNLGLETALTDYRTLLVSDAGMRPSAEPTVGKDPVRQTVRVLEVADAQVRALRKRQLLDCFRAQPAVWDGAYWSSNSDIRNFGLGETLPCPWLRTQELALVPTRLARLSAEWQERLINWGYAVCDAAMRAHVLPGARGTEEFPYSRGV